MVSIITSIRSICLHASLLIGTLGERNEFSTQLRVHLLRHMNVQTVLDKRKAIL
jgi:hypothetical protein